MYIKIEFIRLWSILALLSLPSLALPVEIEITEATADTPEPVYEHGIVKWYSLDKGYGFIQREGGADIFVSQMGIREGSKILNVGDRVSFKVTQTPKGVQAEDVFIEK